MIMKFESLRSYSLRFIRKWLCDKVKDESGEQSDLELIDLVNFIIDCNGLDHILQSLHYEDTQADAAWILINITSCPTEQTASAVEAGAILELTRILSLKVASNVLTNALWALSNIVGDCPECALEAVDCELIPKLYELLKEGSFTNQMDVPRKIAHIVLNISRHCTSADFRHPSRHTCVCEIVQDLFPIICILFFTDDHDTLISICFSLSRIIRTPSPLDRHMLRKVISCGLIPRMLYLVSDSEMNSRVQHECMLILQDISAGSNSQTQALLDAGILHIIPRFLLDRHCGRKGKIQKAAVAILYNVSVGIRGHKEALQQSGLLLPFAFSECGIPRSGILEILNAENFFTSSGYFPSILDNFISIIHIMLDTNDAEMALDALFGVHSLLEADNKVKLSTFLQRTGILGQIQDKFLGKKASSPLTDSYVTNLAKDLFERLLGTDAYTW